ncbi:scp-like extracellular, partial [Colletotrichum musicola]
YHFGSSDPPYTSATTWWLNEITLYDGQPIPESSPKGTFEDYGHYTQAVWRETEEVGMAIANSGDGRTYVVARYSPAGNVYGQTPY